MPSRRRAIRPPAPFVCHEHTDALPVADALPLVGDLHPGWKRASAILLRGLKRLEEREQYDTSRLAEEDNKAA